jgi:hypothetical protein
LRKLYPYSVAGIGNGCIVAYMCDPGKLMYSCR